MTLYKGPISFQSMDSPTGYVEAYDKANINHQQNLDSSAIAYNCASFTPAGGDNVLSLYGGYTHGAAPAIPTVAGQYDLALVTKSSMPIGVIPPSSGQMMPDNL